MSYSEDFGHPSDRVAHRNQTGELEPLPAYRLYADDSDNPCREYRSKAFDRESRRVAAILDGSSQARAPRRYQTLEEQAEELRRFPDPLTRGAA